jgi:hypothetical protein
MKLTKEKAANPYQGEAAQQENFIPNNTPPDALLQWHALAANAKKSQQTKRQSPRGWKRGRK